MSDWRLPSPGLPTVTGGVQTFHVLFDGVPFDGFEAASEVGQVIGGAPSDFVTQATPDEGDGWIRLLEPGTGRLFQRFQASVRPVTSVDVGVMINGGIFWLARPTPGTQWAFAPGWPGQVIVMLESHDARRLIDQRLTIGPAPGDAAIVEQLVWDRARVTPTAEGARLLVAAGDGSALEASLPMVDATTPYDILVAEGWGDLDQLWSYSYYQFCFRAYADDVTIANLPVAIAAPPDLNAVPSERPGCIDMIPYLSGTYALITHAGDLTKEFTVVVH